MNRRLKIALIILLIILISIISFVGLFIQNTKFMENILPEYQLGMDLRGHRAITIEVSDETTTKYYDEQGNEVDKEVENGSSKEVPINSEDVLTLNNYKSTKKIIEKRLADVGVSEYLIRLNENNGTITVQLPEDSITDLASQFLYTRGVFTLEDENGQVLLDNSNIDAVKVGYTTTTSGTTIYLNIEFNKDSVETLREISNTYVESKDEEENDTTKKVELNIDGSTLLQTSFSEEISNGVLQLIMGTSTDNEKIQSNIQDASNIAILLNDGTLPIEYTVEQNRFVKSDITLNDFIIPAIVLGVIIVLAYLFLIIKYKKLGLLALISHVGYTALLLIIVRYTNLVITILGICGLLISIVLDYILLVYILKALKNTEKNLVEYKKVFDKSLLSIILVLIPALVIGVVMSFATWLPVYSFGTIVFWGMLILGLYNVAITRILFLNSINERKNNK